MTENEQQKSWASVQMRCPLDDGGDDHDKVCSRARPCEAWALAIRRHEESEALSKPIVCLMDPPLGPWPKGRRCDVPRCPVHDPEMGTNEAPTPAAIEVDAEGLGPRAREYHSLRMQEATPERIPSDNTWRDAHHMLRDLGVFSVERHQKLATMLQKRDEERAPRTDKATPPQAAMTPAEFAQALSDLGALLHDIWRGDWETRRDLSAKYGTRVADAFERFGKHPSYFLGCYIESDCERTCEHGQYRCRVQHAPRVDYPQLKAGDRVHWKDSRIVLGTGTVGNTRHLVHVKWDGLPHFLEYDADSFVLDAPRSDSPKGGGG